MENNIIHTTSGMVKGYERNGMLEFLGIPFADAPTGKKRFKRAVPKTPWKGVYNAFDYGPSPVQIDKGFIKGSEDCLFVNIKRPLEGEDLPVLVFIYGGGYNNGSTDDLLYYGDAFVKDGIVFVSFQYRLNVLGFYDFTTFPGCEDFDSNCGLSDQILAMHWIHDNICAFGGDPDRITICGESAGGASVINLLASPRAKGTFSQAIAESSLPNCIMTHETARENIMIFLDAMGWSANENIGDRLKSADPFTLLTGNEAVQKKGQYRNPGMFLPGPIQDDLLPKRPIEAIRDGDAKDIKLIIGTTRHEGTLFVHPEDTGFPNSWEMIEEMMSKNGYEDAFLPISEYYGSLEEDPFIQFATDYAFRMPAIKVALAQHEYNKDTWMFRYDLVTKTEFSLGMRATHACELPAVFAVRKGHPWVDLIFDGEDENVIDSIIGDVHGAWVRFIKYGNPSAEDNEWERFTGMISPVRIFDRESRSMDLNFKALMNVWGDMRFYEN